MAFKSNLDEIPTLVERCHRRWLSYENEIRYTYNVKWGIHFIQVTPTSCGWAHGASASQSATIDRYGVGSTATACCTRR